MNKIASCTILLLAVIFVVGGNVKTAKTSGGKGESRNLMVFKKKTLNFSPQTDNEMDAMKECNETYQIKSGNSKKHS